MQGARNKRVLDIGRQQQVSEGCPQLGGKGAITTGPKVVRSSVKKRGKVVARQCSAHKNHSLRFLSPSGAPVGLKELCGPPHWPHAKGTNPRAVAETSLHHHSGIIQVATVC